MYDGKGNITFFAQHIWQANEDAKQEKCFYNNRGKTKQKSCIRSYFTVKTSLRSFEERGGFYCFMTVLIVLNLIDLVKEILNAIHC